MKHVKTLNTKRLQTTVKKVVVENVRHLVSQLAKHLVQLEIKVARTMSTTNANRKKIIDDRSPMRAVVCALEESEVLKWFINTKTMAIILFWMSIVVQYTL